MVFSWKYALERQEKFLQERYSALAGCNKEWAVQHPDIVSDLAKGSKTLIKKMIKEKMDKVKQNNFPPEKQHIARFNRR